MRKLGTFQGHKVSDRGSKARSAWPQTVFPETILPFTPWTGFSHPSSFFSPLHTSLFNQARTASHPDQSESRATGRSETLYHSLLLVSYPSLFISRPSTFYKPAPHLVYSNKCRPGRGGAELRSRSVMGHESSAHRVTAWVDKGCQKQKSEQWSPLRWGSDREDHVWGAGNVLNLIGCYLHEYID